MTNKNMRLRQFHRWSYQGLVSFLFTFGMAMLSQNAEAEPLLKMDNGEPQAAVITKWEAKGKKTMLTVRDDVDAKEIAELINEEIDRIKAKVKGGRIQVQGKSMSDLLQVLSEIEFGDDDDFGALAEASMEDDLDSGSSLRAKKVADLKKLFSDSKSVAIGKIVRVQKGVFPNTLVTVQILRGPTGQLGQQIRKGAKINFEPVISKGNKSVSWKNESNQINAGAWFLKRGDKVVVRIGKPLKGGFKARLLERR